MRTSSRACSPSRAPMSMCSSRISATFLRSSSRSRWIGFLPTTPGTGPAAGVEHDALADEDLRVPAADFAEPQVAVVVDVGDDQPDLVDVAHHEQPRARRARRRAAGDTSASGVPTTSVLTSRTRSAAVAPHGRRRRSRSRTGRARRAGRAAAAGRSAPRGAAAARARPAAGLMRRAGRAARTGGCRRGGSSRPRAACRCARAPRTRPARAPSRSARTRTSRGGAPPSAIASARPVIENISSPVRPSDAALCPSGNCSGSTPMPTGSSGGCARSSAAITARTPSSRVPLAAQSREEPEPYSLARRARRGRYAVARCSAWRRRRSTSARPRRRGPAL